jgi:RNA binding exosome subunit
MKYAHFIEMRVFSKEEDTENEIVKKVKELFPFDFEQEKIELQRKTAYGFEEKKIIIFTVDVNKERHTRKVLENLMKNLNQEQKDLLLKQLDTRLDDSLHFYLRLDKKKFLNNEYFITDKGNCFHFKIAIAAYAHIREKAEEVVKEILDLKYIFYLTNAFLAL